MVSVCEKAIIIKCCCGAAQGIRLAVLTASLLVVDLGHPVSVVALNDGQLAIVGQLVIARDDG